ncbi:HAD family hydrolase [Stappia stellulata]|uniref:HAD family hydrolase n=1 Tax=Stappia stellulata TaxID=71235 RepID=UPI000409C76C|nr:HAD family hydrolase [Stappia stellulata]
MTFPEIRAVLFDKDGTLLDFDKSWAPVNRSTASWAAGGDAAFADRLMAVAGFDPMSEKTRSGSLYAAGNTAEIAEAWRAAGVRLPLPELVAELDRRFTENATRAVAVPRLAETVGGLSRRGLLLGIASSDSKGAIARFVATVGLSDRFAFLAGYDSGYGYKPGPGMLTAFSEKTGIPASQIAMVGDNLHDLEMARAGHAGLRVAVLTGTGTREELAPHADLCLASIADLPEALDVHHASA